MSGGVLRTDDLCDHGLELALVLLRPLPEPLVEYAKLALKHARAFPVISFGESDISDWDLLWLILTGVAFVIYYRPYRILCLPWDKD